MRKKKTLHEYIFFLYQNYSFHFPQTCDTLKHASFEMWFFIPTLQMWILKIRRLNVLAMVTHFISEESKINHKSIQVHSLYFPLLFTDHVCDFL